MKSKPHLFPHSYLPVSAIKKVISLFGPVRIYQPWFINPPEFIKNIELEIVNPPDYLKPKEDLKAILSGYRLWAEQNHDRSHREILKFSDRTYQDDNATWEIRRLLRGAAQPSAAAKEKELTLKWHLLLHLAYEIERQNFEVRDMLNALKEKGPLVAGALHDPGEMKNSFTDMADLAASDAPDALNIGLALDAWFGLFAGYLNENDLLITCSNSVMDYISMQWDDTALEGKVADPFTMKREVEEGYPWDLSQGETGITLRHFPSFPEGSSESKKILRHIAGKTIVFVSLP